MTNSGACALILVVFYAVHPCLSLNSTTTNQHFMVAAGMSSQLELCLAVENGKTEEKGAPVILESCAAAVAAGDGREQWQINADGKFVNVPGSLCLGAATASDDSGVVLVECDTNAAATWAFSGDNQLKSTNGQCLTQNGANAKTQNMASNAAVTASSTAPNAGHGAELAVDGDPTSFWASNMDVASPVVMIFDLGEQQTLQRLGISWEFAAQSFAVSISKDGEHWIEVFATDTNVLKSSDVALGFARASKVRIEMRKPHPVHGRFMGHALYGIRAVGLYASPLTTVLGDCLKAAKSADARDKYFAIAVSESDPCPSKSLRSEVPALEAAVASVAAAASELSGVIPQLASCRTPSMLSGQRQFGSHDAGEVGTSLAAKSFMRAPGASHLVTMQNGIDVNAIKAVLSETRSAIIATRSALA